MPKISALPAMTSPDAADPAPVVDTSATTTKKMTLGGIRDWLYSLVDIPTGPASPVTRDSEHFANFVVSGLVWSGDAYASTRNASMTSGTVYINGRRISISSVTARTFTASRDTYIDILDNADGTGTIVYTEVTNNNASPALAANSIRIGIIVTGAANIAAVGSVNQGQRNKVLPIASSIAYTKTDSLGNMICNRKPLPSMIGYKQIIVSFSTTSASAVQATGLSVPVLIDFTGEVKITVGCRNSFNDTATGYALTTIWDGTVGSGTQLQEGAQYSSAANAGSPLNLEVVDSVTPGLKTYNVGLARSGGVTAHLQSPSGAITPVFVKVERI